MSWCSVKDSLGVNLFERSNDVHQWVGSERVCNVAGDGDSDAAAIEVIAVLVLVDLRKMFPCREASSSDRRASWTKAAR